MPAKANSLKVTDAYRRRMVAIRERAKSEARKTWSRVRLSDLDATYNPTVLILSVTAMQREAAQLSAGYLGAFIASETDRKVPEPVAMAMQAGDARGGVALLTAFRGPLIGVKVDIGEGMDPSAALHKGGSKLVRLAGLATDEAAREALRLAMDAAPEVEGWKRAVRGTCAACMGMAEGSTLPPGAPLEIHPDCQCVAEPATSRPLPSLPTKTELGLSAEQQGALNLYEGGGYAPTNQALRAAQSLDPDLARQIELLDEAIERAPALEQTGNVWRGIKRGKLDDLFDLPGDEADWVGKVLTDPGYSSASNSRGVAELFVRDGDILRVTLPKGERPLSLGGADEEMLLGRGRRYVIRAVRHERGGEWGKQRDFRVIEVDVLP